MSKSCRLFAVWLSAVVIAPLTSVFMPQAVFAQPREHSGIGIRRPQFVVTAVSIHSVHETGTNWPGNDEVVVLLSDFVGPLVSAWFYNVDAGETFAIGPQDRCIQPQPACDRGVTNVHFRVALWENDELPPPLLDWCYGYVPGSPGDYFFEHGVCSGDDLIGRAEMTLSQQQLVAMLPTVGASVDRTIRPSGGDGIYDFTYRITRLPDVGRDIVIGPTAQPAISLQATVTSSNLVRRVTLAWSGATTNTVDIYRNGAKLTTTANDGSHVDFALTAGTYRYRLCNLGSTVCSADVEVVVS